MAKPLTLAALNLTDNYTPSGGEEWLQGQAIRSRPTSTNRRTSEPTLNANGTLMLSADEYAPLPNHRLPPIAANGQPSASFVEGSRTTQPNRLAPASFMRKGSARNGGKSRTSGVGGLSGLGVHAADDIRGQQSPSPPPELLQATLPTASSLAADPSSVSEALEQSPSQVQFDASSAPPPPPLLPPGWQAWQAERAGWSQSSVGDLEALDSILDHLVVLDNRMRSALMRGPAISFETVVPESRSGYNGDAENELLRDEQDLTFLTSVKGQGQRDSEDEDVEARVSAGRAALTFAGPAPTAFPPRGDVDVVNPRMNASPPSRVGLHSSAGTTPVPGMSHHGLSHGYGGLDKLTITVATPVMPRLTRLYLGNKAAQLSKAPPAPPATAEYLLRSRPPPFISAPSYDTLCNQIQSVQRQYTCGTSGRDTSPGRPPVDNAMQTSNYNQYISGLDGPSLDMVVNTVDLPIVLERARPSFVKMHKLSRKKKIRGRTSPRAATTRVGRSVPIGMDGVEGYGNNSGGEYTDSD